MGPGDPVELAAFFLSLRTVYVATIIVTPGHGILWLALLPPHLH